MKADFKTGLFIGAGIILLMLAAYFVGVSQGGKSAQSIIATAPVLPTPNTGKPVSVQNEFPLTSSGVTSVFPARSSADQASQAKVSQTKASPTDARFAHFRVGNRNVKGMLADGELVWVGTSGGVLRYDLTTDDYKLFDVAAGNLLSNGVFHLSKLDGRIVIGTYGGGMTLHDPAKGTWKNYNIPDGLADQFVYDVQEVSNGDVWIATWSGVNRVKQGRLDDPSQWQTFNVENTQGGLPNDWVYGLEEGKDGEMWFATEKGLARYQNGQWKNWNHEQGFGAPLALVKDDIQFTTDPGQNSRHHAQQKEEQGLPRTSVAYNPNYVVSLEVDAHGIVWAGTWGGGLVRFDGETFTNFTVKDGLPSNHVFLVYMDPRGQVWAGTSHGLAKVNDQAKSFKVFTRNEGLYSDNVFSMSYAQDGSYWIGSFGGVARLSGNI